MSDPAPRHGQWGTWLAAAIAVAAYIYILSGPAWRSATTYGFPMAGLLLVGAYVLKTSLIRTRPLKQPRRVIPKTDTPLLFERRFPGLYERHVEELPQPIMDGVVRVAFLLLAGGPLMAAGLANLDAQDWGRVIASIGAAGILLVFWARAWAKSEAQGRAAAS